MDDPQESGCAVTDTDDQRRASDRTLNDLVDAESVVDAVASPAFVVGADHTVLAYNDGLADLLGIDPGEALGEDCRESIAAAAYADERRRRSLADKVVEAPRNAATAFESVSRADGERRYSGDHVYEDKSTMQNARGEERLIQFVATPLFEDGDLVAVVELVSENDPAREGSTDLAGVLAHDLRNPLEVAKTYTELASDDIDDEHYDRIRDSLDWMENIIEDTMAIYRQTMAEQDVHDHDLATVARLAWDTVETDSATLETDGGSVACDRAQMVALLENLFRNAVEHGTSDGQSGTASLTVRVGPLDDREGFYVEDTGDGIPADQRQIVLEHGHSTTSNGTGLGLSIVQQIARNHDWEVAVDESAEGGARFEFVVAD